MRELYYIKGHTLAATGEEVCEPRVEIALDTIGREFGEQSEVPVQEQLDVTG